MSDLQTITVPDAETYNADSIDPMAWSRGQDQPGQDPGTINLTVYPDMRYQQINGIGGSFSEVGSDYLESLSADQRQAACEALFHPDQGACRWCRMPMGASDFGRDAYSFADQADDLDLNHFSIERDRNGILRFIKAAQAVQADLHVHASPWSPPAWLKDSNSMVQGGSLIRDQAHYDCYAQYFVKFVQAYAAEGVAIARVCQQNEPDVPTPYPSCVMMPDQMVPWTVEHLQPAFAAAQLPTEIWGGTFRMVGGLQSHECLQDANFRQAVSGLGFQYSFCDNIRDLARLHPDVPLMHTESVCHDGANSWEQAGMLFDDILNYFRAGCDVYTYWNMALDSGGMSTWNWRQNSLISIDTEAGTWTSNPDLTVLGLFGRHLVQGARRIEAFSFQRPAMAIEKPDGSLVAFVANHEDRSAPLRVHIAGRTDSYELPPRAMAAVTL